MDTNKLEQHMDAIATTTEKIRSLLPELQSIPADIRAVYQNSHWGFAICCLSWSDWKTIRRHFGSRLRPIRRYTIESDQSHWFIYQLDGDLQLLLGWTQETT